MSVPQMPVERHMGRVINLNCLSFELWSLGNSLGLGGSPCAIRSRQVAHAEAVLAQDARRDIGALAALAIRDDFAVARQLAQALAQLIQWNVRRTGNEPSRAFVGTADIQQQRRAGIERSNFVPLRECHVTGEHVLRGHAGKVDGVFRRSVRRRIGQFQFGQIVNGHPGLERGGQYVNAFVHAFMADGLSAEQFACVGREQDFQRDGFGAGVVARVRAGVKMNRLEMEWRRDEGISHLRPCNRR